MSKEPKQCTVRELRQMLKDMPQDALVETEGCDCWGTAYKPKVVDGIVVIIRTDDMMASEERKDERKDDQQKPRTGAS